MPRVFGAENFFYSLSFGGQLVGVHGVEDFLCGVEAGTVAYGGVEHVRVRVVDTVEAVVGQPCHEFFYYFLRCHSESLLWMYITTRRL